MTRRRLLYIPAINAKTFLFFFFRGESGRSYSLRDYSQSGSPHRTTARDYSYTSDEILALAVYDFEAPVVPVTELAFWGNRVEDLNRRFLGKAHG